MTFKTLSLGKQISARERLIATGVLKPAPVSLNKIIGKRAIARLNEVLKRRKMQNLHVA